MTGIDVFCIVIILLVMVIGYSRGAVNMLLGLAALIISVVIAGLVAPNITDWIINNTTISQSISNTISENIIKNLDAQKLELFTKMPGVDSLGTLAQQLSDLMQSGNSDMSVVVTQAVTPVVKKVVNALIYFIVLIVCMTVFGVIRRLSRRVNDVPVIGVLNRILGGGIGLVMGVIVASLGVLALYYYGVYGTHADLLVTIQQGLLSGPIITTLT